MTTATEESAQNAIVTGAAQGIGRAIALRLAKEGYNVCVADLDRSRELLNGVKRDIEALGVKGTIVCGDVGNKEDVDQMVQVCVQELGSLYGACRPQDYYTARA